MRRFRAYLAQKRAEAGYESWFKREMRQEQLEAWAAEQASKKISGQTYDPLYDHYLKFQGR